MTTDEKCGTFEKIKYDLQGRVRFPIGGIVRERASAGLGKCSSQDLVRFQNRQYSLDERRCDSVWMERSICSLRKNDFDALKWETVSELF